MQDWMSKLERAKALFDAGGLTQEEFEAEKQRLLPRALGPEEPKHHQGETTNFNDSGSIRAEPDHAAIRRFPSFFRSAIGLTLVAAAAVIGYFTLAGSSSTPIADLPHDELSPLPSHAIVERQPSIPVTRPAPAAQAYQSTKSSTATRDNVGEATPVEPDWTPAQKELLSIWSNEMRECDPAAELTEEVASACARLEAVEEEMKSSGICTVPVPETDAVSLRRCR